MENKSQSDGDGVVANPVLKPPSAFDMDQIPGQSHAPAARAAEQSPSDSQARFPREVRTVDDRSAVIRSGTRPEQTFCYSAACLSSIARTLPTSGPLALRAPCMDLIFIRRFAAEVVTGDQHASRQSTCRIHLRQ